MKKLVLALLLLSAASFSQELPEHAPYGGVGEWVHGSVILPVANKPFSAKAIIESTKALPDGTKITRKTWNTIARDSAGRTHNEGRRLINGNDSMDPALLFFAVVDPAARTRSVVTPAQRQIRVFHLTNVPTTFPPSPPSPPGVTLSKLDLGDSTLDGLAVHGTRETRSYGPGLVGNDKTFEVTDEYWFSPELQLNLSVIHNDPRTGIQTVKITELSRGEPDGTLFQMPPDYKVTNMGSMAGAVQIGKGVTPPHATYSPNPQYTDAARKARTQGSVMLNITIDPDGTVRDVRVLRSLDPELDDSAIAAVQTWRFEPAKKDGNPVAVRVNVEVNFRLQ